MSDGEDGSLPSTRNVTGRRKTKQNNPSHDGNDDFRHNLSKAAQKKNQNRTNNDVDQNLANEIQKLLSEMNDKKRKVTSTNCFDTKTPLDMFNIEDIVKSNIKIQDMAIVLDSSQQIYSYRVDRLLAECKGTALALNKGGPIEVEQPEQEKTDEGEDTGKKKKKKNMPDGMADMEAMFNEMDKQDLLREPRDENELDENGDERDLLTGHMIYPDDEDTRGDGIEGVDWDENFDVKKEVNNLLSHRVSIIETDIFRDASTQIVPDDKQIEISPTDGSWTKTNSYYQKASIGAQSDVTSSFRSLLYNGLYTKDGRVFKLHPRIEDPDRNKPIKPQSVKFDVINNMRNIIANAMSSDPYKLPNNLMLEVTNRPKTGQFKLMRASASLMNGTKANTASTSAGENVNDMTLLIPTSGTSGPPSANQDITLFGGAASPEIGSAMTISDGPGSSTVQQHIPRLAMRTASMTTTITDEASSSDHPETVQRAQELESVPFNDILLDDSIEDYLPIMPDYPTQGLSAILDVKATLVDDEDDDSKKIWKKGVMAEEWDDQSADITRDVLPVMTSGIDSYFRALDYMVNADVVKMVFNRETLARLDALDRNMEYDESHPSARRKPVHPDKYYILKPSDAYTKLFPQDRKDHFIRIDDDDGIPIASTSNDDDEMDDEDAGGGEDYFYEGAGEDIQFNESLVGNINDDAARNLEYAGEDDNVAEAFFGGVDDEGPSTSGRDEQLDLNETALGLEEIPELMTAGRPEHKIQIRPEVEAEIRNLGKADNAHWKAPNTVETADSKLAKKKKEKKVKKRVGIDDFLSYFEETTEVDTVEKVSSIRCQEVRNPSSLLLKESQIYMNEISTESKPFTAFRPESLIESGIMYKKKYGKLKVEQVPSNLAKYEDVLVDDMRGNGGNIESDCLNWLLSFNGFKCSFKSDPNTSLTDAERGPDTQNNYSMDNEDYGMDMMFDDREEERDQEYMKQQAMAKMGEHYSEKYQNVLRMSDDVKMLLRRQNVHEDLFGDDDDMLSKKNLRANNLDAAKHKKCIADILNSADLSMPKIQYMVEMLSKKWIHPNNIQGTSQEDQRASMTTPEPQDDDEKKGLAAVFDYKTPDKSGFDVQHILTAFRDVPDYQEEQTNVPRDEQAQIDPSNPPVQKVNVSGVHTFMSMMLCMPQRMGERVEPSSILSFALHLCNENNLHLVQDRSKRNWMTDFLILNEGENIPVGMEIGDVAEVDDDFWKESLDPCAKIASPTSSSHSENLPSTSKATTSKTKVKKAVAKKLNQIEEEEEEEIEDEL